MSVIIPLCFSACKCIRSKNRSTSLMGRQSECNDGQTVRDAEILPGRTLPGIPFGKYHIKNTGRPASVGEPPGVFCKSLYVRSSDQNIFLTSMVQYLLEIKT